MGPDFRLLQVLTWLVGALLVVLLGIVGWVAWVSVTGQAVSNVEIMRVVEESNRQLRLANCLLLLNPTDRTAQAVANCATQLAGP